MPGLKETMMGFFTKDKEAEAREKKRQEMRDKAQGKDYGGSTKSKDEKDAIDDLKQY